MDRLSAYSLLAFLVLAGSARADESAETFFETKIRPVLATDCLPCHGGKKTESGLKVDSRESLLKGGDRGPAIVAGEPENSLLVRAIRLHRRRVEDAPQAPPARGGGVGIRPVGRRRGGLARTSKPRSRRGRGLRAARHWAFQRIKAVVPPPDPTGESSRPIDRFIAAKRRAAGLRPVRPADRRTLIRRVTFDLIGLPPTPEEVADFENDGSPAAFSRVVDRLLASPHYGERWGRHWMDVVRYADTAGDNADYPVPEAARYRDYIIDSFNRDKPFDQFVREQLAGDILARQGAADNYAESVVATGFLALSRRYATAPVRALAPDTRRHDRDDRPRLPGAHAPLRPLPRPQVRPGQPARLLRPLRHLRQHDLPLRRLRGVAIERLPAAEFRPAGRTGAGRAQAEGLSAIDSTKLERHDQGARVEERPVIGPPAERPAARS